MYIERWYERLDAITEGRGMRSQCECVQVCIYMHDNMHAYNMIVCVYMACQNLACACMCVSVCMQDDVYLCLQNPIVT